MRTDRTKGDTFEEVCEEQRAERNQTRADHHRELDRVLSQLEEEQAAGLAVLEGPLQPQLYEWWIAQKQVGKHKAHALLDEKFDELDAAAELYLESLRLRFESVTVH